MVMSAGVYKSIEAAVDEAQTIGAFNAVAKWFHAHVQIDLASASQMTLNNLAHVHEKAYMQNLNPTACRKRDDMTLLVYTFHDQVSNKLLLFICGPLYVSLKAMCFFFTIAGSDT